MSASPWRRQKVRQDPPRRARRQPRRQPAMSPTTPRSSSLRSQPRHLLKADDDELGGLQGREADDDVDDARVDVVLRGRFVVALDEIRLLRRGTLERPLAEQAVE